MKLVGEVAQEYELEGNETLSKLVDRFTLEHGVLNRGNIPAIDKNFRKNIRDEQRNIRQTIGKMVKEIPLSSHESQFDEAIDALIAGYIHVEFDSKYDRISSDLFDLKRCIPYFIQEWNKEVDLKIPLFARVLYGEDSTWNFRKKLEQGDRYDRSECNIHIASDVPPVPREVKEKARIAKADYSDFFARSLREPVIGDLMMQDERPENSFSLKTYWIPKESELHLESTVIDRDPVLIGNIAGRDYLIAKWDVKGEEPYQHYIEEFTESKAK